MPYGPYIFSLLTFKTIKKKNTVLAAGLVTNISGEKEINHLLFGLQFILLNYKTFSLSLKLLCPNWLYGTKLQYVSSCLLITFLVSHYVAYSFRIYLSPPAPNSFLQMKVGEKGFPFATFTFKVKFLARCPELSR